MGKVLRQQSRSEEAWEEYQKALAIQQQLAEKGSVAETELAIAELDCDSNQAAEAEHLTRSALAQFQAQREPIQQISALILLARSSLEEGSPEAAKNFISQARTLSAKTPDVIRQLSLEITRAYLLADLRDFRGAETAAERVTTKANALGLVRLYLEASLALGEFQLKGKVFKAGHELLQNVTKSARSRGFERIARIASATS